MRAYKWSPRQVKCPVCQGDNARSLWKTNSYEAAQHFVLKERDPERFLELVSHIESLWNGKNCEVVQCNKCEFCYSNPYIAGDARFYELAYEYHSNMYPGWKWEFQLTYEVITRFATPEHRLLEIGAGDGAFLKRVVNSTLHKENVLCTEFSEYGKNKIQKFGVTCLSADVRTLSNPELRQSFDIVCMFQVLEHLDRLDRLFRRINWLMKEGGHLFIAVPNPRRIEFNELNGALLDMPPNHIGRWNKKCFAEIGHRHGFRLKDLEIEEGNFLSSAMQFAAYTFLKKAQTHESLENRIRGLRNRQLRGIMQVVGVAANVVLGMPTLARMDHMIGTGLWVELIKL